MSTPQRPQADGSVRLATTDDAAAIASIQAAAYRILIWEILIRQGFVDQDAEWSAMVVVWRKLPATP